MLSLFIPAGILLAAGLAALSSISMHFFWLQLIWVAPGVGLVVLFYFVDWRFILNYRWLIAGLYAFAIILLVLVYLKGPVVRNIRSWLVLGPLNFQPVELAKISLIFLFASFFSRRHIAIARWRNIVTSFVFFLVPAVLTAIEPELGSVLVLFGIWFGFLLLSGLPPRRVLVAFLLFVIAGIFVWSFVLKDFHRARIVGFFYPESNSLGTNYSSIQSKIAVGSAGFWGKGYGQGTQTQLGFLTEPQSDFILASFVEEWGSFGGLVVITAFLFLIYGILKVGVKVDGNFEKFICLGTAAAFGMQFFLNAASELGLVPVIGITFPFLSYGGSSLVTSFFLLAVVNAIGRKEAV